MTEFVEKFMVQLYVFWKAFWVLAYTAYIKITGNRPKVNKCLVGKTALVTGGNDGIGYEICMHLASRGCTVIIADRSESEKSRQKIIRETGNPNVISKTFDLASFKSVRDLAKDLSTCLSQLDILVNNAGIASIPPGQLTEDGFDPVMQINYLGHFLLTHLLLDLMKKSKSGRMLFTSSSGSHLEDIHLNDFNFDSGKVMMIQMYCNSKWGMLVASNYFNKQLNESGIISTAYHPGIYFSNMYNALFADAGLVGMIFYYNSCVSNWIFGRKAWEIGEFAVYLVTCEENVGGKAFFQNQGFSLTPSRSKDAQFCKKFIETSQKLVRLSASEKLD